jgi:hypothetical protein
MLAEKFFLLLETLKGRTHPDGSPRVVSSSPHVPVKLSSAKEAGAEAAVAPSFLERDERLIF